MVLLAALAALSVLCHAQVPPNYPSSYAEMVTAGRKEGTLLIYSTTDAPAANPLIKDFEAMYPGIKVQFHELSSGELYNRFLGETASRGSSADVLWSAAMDLQIKLANDGYAATYKSPETPQLPEWAVWREEAFGTTFEPAVFVYNKRLLAADEVPQSHSDLVRLLNAKPAKFRGKVATYDIDKSAVGFLFATQDSRALAAFWNLAKALGASGLDLESNTAVMMEHIASGDDLLGYNLIGSYAMTRAKRDPSLGIVLPKDYTLVMSRVLLIAKRAKNPNAARLWTDYLLSKRGQTLLAQRSDLFSIRADVDGEFTAAALTKALGASLYPINVGPGLLVYLDQAKRKEFLKRWQQATTGAK